MGEIHHENVREGLSAHLPRLWRYGLSLCRDATLAEELVQATCVRALERESQFVRGTNLRAWLFTILSSIWKNHLRAEKVRAGTGQEDPEQVLTFDGNTSLEMNNLYRRVLSGVTALPEPQRQAVLLVYVEEFTYREAAHILEVPIGTIMSRLSAARARLSDLRGPADDAAGTEDRT